jgi:gas vesicle protein
MKDQEQMLRIEKRPSTFMTLMRGMFIGGLVGAGIALLTAPRSGLETRELLRSKTEEFKAKASETADQTRARADELLRSGSNRATEIKQRSEEVLNQQKANVVGVVEGVKEGVRTYSELNQSGKTS